MACMCGDYCCNSCGPAQGNWKCPICRAWSTECCEHMAEDGNDLKPEFHERARQIAEQEAEADELYAIQMQEEDRLWAKHEAEQAELRSRVI